MMQSISMYVCKDKDKCAHIEEAEKKFKESFEIIKEMAENNRCDGYCKEVRDAKIFIAKMEKKDESV